MPVHAMVVPAAADDTLFCASGPVCVCCCSAGQWRQGFGGCTGYPKRRACGVGHLRVHLCCSAGDSDGKVHLLDLRAKGM
jgi:hypothetical protein